MRAHVNNYKDIILRTLAFFVVNEATCYLNGRNLMHF